MTATVSSIVASGIGIAGGNGNLNAGRTVRLTVNVSEAVTVAGGTPTLSLNDPGIATYDAVHSTATALAFNYTVATGHNTADLAVTALNLNGATIQDGGAGNADLAGAVTNPAGTLRIDTVGPHVLNFAAIDPLTTNANAVHYTVAFSEPVIAVDASAFNLISAGVTGASIAGVTPVGGSDGTQYIVTVNTGTGNGTIALDFTGGDIRDRAGNALPGGTFALQSPSAALGERPGPGAIGDVNGDGKLDLVVPNTNADTALFHPDTVSVLLGNGDGTFQSPNAFATADAPFSVAIADLNGDGKPDLALGNIDTSLVDTLSVLLGNGDGTFQAPQNSPMGVTPYSVVAGDFNEDGIPDLAAANLLDDTVSVRLGNGDGTFQPRATFATGDIPASVAVADLNRDGTLDLAVTNANSGNVSVLLGNGDGTFQAHTTYATAFDTGSVVIGDLNADGKPDLAAVNSNSSTLSVLLGNGDGTFQAQVVYAATTQPARVAIGDLNGDGIPDLVTANLQQEPLSRISILLGNGDGTLQGQIHYRTGLAPGWVGIGDLNGDGRPDLVTLDLVDETASTLLNNPPPALAGETYTIDRTAPPPTTATFGFRLVDATVTYEGNQVIIDSGSSHTVLIGIDTYVFTDGTVNTNDGDPLVDDLFYYSRYHDVWNAHADADGHYHSVGWHEHRDPSAFFDTDIYLTINPDVAAAGVDPLTHYHTAGWTEHRSVSVTFDGDRYLVANPDVAAAHVDPLAHFLADGAAEGRQPFAPTEVIAANGFDYVYYLQQNPDVAAAGVDAFQHFQTTGWHEGRDPNALFDTSGYLAAYTDVAAANVNPLDHYHQFGWREGRDPSVNFDTTDYRAAYPDVAAAQVDPLQHFLKFGIHEGRSAFPDGAFG